MFFPRRLKKTVSVEEFVNTFNSMNLTGGELKAVSTDAPFAPSYIVFSSYSDPRCAVCVALFDKKGETVVYVKAQVVDISSFENRLVDNTIGSVIGSAGGRMGLIIADHASGMAKKRKEAKRLAKTTDKEILTVLAKLDW